MYMCVCEEDVHEIRVKRKEREEKTKTYSYRQIDRQIREIM